MGAKGSKGFYKAVKHREVEADHVRPLSVGGRSASGIDRKRVDEEEGNSRKAKGERSTMQRGVPTQFGRDASAGRERKEEKGGNNEKRRRIDASKFKNTRDADDDDVDDEGGAEVDAESEDAAEEEKDQEAKKKEEEKIEEQNKAKSIYCGAPLGLTFIVAPLVFYNDEVYNNHLN